MITHEQAENLAQTWLNGWNRHDLDAVLAHYADDVEFASPAIVEITGDQSGTLQGKDALRSYFAGGLAKYPNLGFELQRVLVGVDSVTLLIRSLHRDRLAAEVMTLDAGGRVTKVKVHYDGTS
jgi:hypothetical protein